MSRRFWGGVLCAGSLSVGLHASGLVAFAPRAAPDLSGGPTQVAMIGNSFEDAAAGRIAPSELVAEHDPVDVTAAQPLTVAPIDETAPVRPDVSQTSVATPALTTVSQAQPITPRAVPFSVAPTVRAAPVAPATASAVPPLVPIAPLAQPMTEAQPAELSPTAPAAPGERIMARPETIAQAPDADTPRPRARPERPAQTADTRPAAQPPAPTGDAEQTTRAGQSDGHAQGNAAQTAQGGLAQSASDGRAVARYPQQVNRHLSRLRRPNARFNGAAVVAFTIAPGGGFAELRVARSSGNAEFDRIAIAHIQRAAPFPAPPPGAQRSFNVTVEGR